jgi:drug/metabolite transporter (DMT)-like permease
MVSEERSSVADIVATATCAIVWGTSWYAITLQFGRVDPIVSLVYRFGLAAAVLFLWCLVRGDVVALSAEQHAAAAGVGLFSFTIDYGFTYFAEVHIVSGVVAVVFATLAFVNLIVFRLVLGQRAPRTAWVAAALGFVGVALLSKNEIVAAVNGRAVRGLAMAFAAVLAAAFGNLSARRGERAGAPLQASLAWAMAYGAVLLALAATITGRRWLFDFKLSYVLSLSYLAIAASVVAFLLYFGLARRRGYTTASYVLALTPILAVTISTLFEGKTWSGVSLVGIALVLGGQWLLLRTHHAKAEYLTDRRSHASRAREAVRANADKTLGRG